MHDNANRRQMRFREYSQKQYDKYRSPMKIHKGDFVYVSPGHSTLLPKLSPPLEGPYKVEKVYRHYGTNEPTAIKVAIPVKDKVEFRTYPRYRVRVIKGLNPLAYWDAFEKESEEEMLRLKDWDFVSPKSLDDSNLIFRIISCIDRKHLRVLKFFFNGCIWTYTLGASILPVWGCVTNKGAIL